MLIQFFSFWTFHDTKQKQPSKTSLPHNTQSLHLPVLANNCICFGGEMTENFNVLLVFSSGCKRFFWTIKSKARAIFLTENGWPSTNTGGTASPWIDCADVFHFNVCCLTGFDDALLHTKNAIRNETKPVDYTVNMTHRKVKFNTILMAAQFNTINKEI